MPTCERQMTGAPVSSSRGIMPAVCGSCNSTTSVGRTRAAISSALACATALVGGPLRLAQRTAVAVVSVESVVQALGDAEELGIAPDHQPSRIAPAAARVADQRTQHLRDAAALGGRVDVPERSRVQQLAPAREGVLERRECLGCEQRRKRSGSSGGTATSSRPMSPGAAEARLPAGVTPLGRLLRSQRLRRDQEHRAVGMGDHGPADAADGPQPREPAAAHHDQARVDSSRSGNDDLAAGFPVQRAARCVFPSSCQAARPGARFGGGASATRRPSPCTRAALSALLPAPAGRRAGRARQNSSSPSLATRISAQRVPAP